ncbi:calcium ion binding protein [Aureococcus anophagefferens]|nr:calcium ion binding protein [Aureococcus anophagefferens]
MRRYCAAAALLLVATRACPDVSFTARNIAVVGSGESVLAIDVDDDGDIDVLAASKNDDTVNWYENDGSQSFTERIITTLADEVRSTYAIDVDGDGDVDALSASLADDTVAWYENDGQSFTTRVVEAAADAAVSDDTVAWCDNDGSESFTERVITTLADGAYSVYAIDVDGDADVDALSFTERVITTLAVEAQSVFAVDVDDDGDVDVVSASAGDDTIAWYVNDGVGVVSKNVVSTLAVEALGVYAIDVDGDGDVDVLSASANDDTVAWYENDGSQSFTERVVTSLAVKAVSVFAFDVDGDGGVGTTCASVSFLERVVSTLANNVFSVFAADVDGDGDVDVLSAGGYSSESEVAWYENDGSLSFTARLITNLALTPQAAYATDVDGDGDVDVLSASADDGKVAWYENDGSQSFTERVVTDSAGYTYTTCLYATDVNDDGSMDVLLARNDDGHVVWYENDGSQSFTERVVSGTIQDTVAWFENDGSQSFTERVVAPSADGARVVFAIDVDGDGDVDVLSGTQEAGSDDNDDTVAWYENDGSESFTERVIIDTLHDVQSVFAIDVNGDGAVDALGVERRQHACTFAIDVDGDGDVDAMSASYRDDTVAWYENDGSQSFTERVITTLANAAISVYAIDVDGDGDVDALSASVNDNTVAWYENDGSRSFTGRVITDSASGANFVFAIDLDGDGDVDVLSASGNDDTIAWYENDGSQSFTERVISNSADVARSVFAIDVDGDGDSFTERVITTLADEAFSVFAIDVDGDGNVDALSASANDDMVAWYENDGSQSFTEHIITDSANGAYSVFALDVDGDGDVDVLSASQWDETVAWYENDGSQFFTQRIITNSADGARSVFAIDFDGDGGVDALSASSQDDTIAWRVVVDLPPGESPLYFLPGDVNGDKDVDVGYSKLDADGSYVFALRSTCDAVSGCADPEVEFASTSQNLGYASDLGNIVLENLDGDGDYDVVTSWGDSDGFGVTVLLDEGDDVWTAIPLKLGGARSVAAGDFNGDGDLDVVAGLPDDDSVYVFQQLRTGFVAGVGEQVVDAAATDVARVAAVDVDGDADLDVVAASAAGLVWYENDGDSIYGDYSYNNNYYGSNDYGGRRLEDYPIAWKAHVVSEEEASSLLAADLDGDEDIDLLTTLGPDLVFGSFVNDGAGTFANYTCHFCPPGAAYAAAGDYDGDGHNDFVVAFVGDETRVVLFAQHEEDFSPINVTTIADAPIGQVFFEDLDGDGDLEILVADFGNGQILALEEVCAEAPDPTFDPAAPRPTDARALPTPEPSSPSPSGAPSAAPSPAPSPAPSTAAPSSFPTPDCSGNASLFSYERGPDVESWAGSTTTSYAGLDGTNGAVLRTLDDADTTLVTFLCAPDDVEVCNTVVFDFGDAVPSGDLFFRVTLGNSSIETSFDDEESPVSTYMFCLSHGAIVRAPTAAPTASPAPTTGSPSDAPHGAIVRAPAAAPTVAGADDGEPERRSVVDSERDALLDAIVASQRDSFNTRVADETPTRPPTIYCHDDAAWYKRDAPSKHCDWVAGYSAGRCEVVGADERLAHEACRASCGCSAPPSAAPSVPPTASFLEITSVGTEQVCVGNLECPILWTYRGPDCATASVVVVSSADGAVVSSAAGVDNSGAATAIVPGDAALSDYEMTIAACGVSGTATLTVSATPAPTLNPTTLSPSRARPRVARRRAPIFINANSPTDAAANDASADVVPADERGPVPSAGDRRHHRVSLVFDDLDAAAFNADASAQEAFRQSLVATVALVESADQVSNVVATSARRRRLDEGAAAEVSYDVTVVVEGASDVDAATADVLATYEADLSDALEDGSYAEALDDAADAEGTDFSFDGEASSVASVEASEVDKPAADDGGTDRGAEHRAGDRAADRRPDGPADGDLRPTAAPTLTPCELVAVPDPPVLAAAAFSSSGARLTLTFDAPTDLAGLDAGALFACGDLFDFPGAADASCYWYNATAADATVDAVVRARRDAAAGPRTTLGVDVRRLRSVRGAVDGRRRPAPGIRVDGGRRRERVLRPRPGERVGRRCDARGARRARRARAAVDLRLNVTNFFGESDVADHVVRITDKAVPSCELVGGDHRTFLRSRRVDVEARASATACDGRPVAARRVAYVWSLADSAGNLIDVASTASNPRFFRLDPLALPLGSYVLTVVAVDDWGYPVLNNTAACTLDITAGDVVALIAGGTARVVAAAEALALSAADSYDEGGSELSFAWNCTGAACPAPLVATGATLAAGPLAPGTYVFAVEATASDGRAASASVAVDVVAVAPPAVSIGGGGAAWNADAKNGVGGYVEASGAARINSTWTLAFGDLAGGARLADVARTPSPRVAVSAAMPPSSGVVAASPASGTAMATAFAAAASLWAGDALPLRYEFSTASGILRVASVEPSAGGLLLAAGTQVITVAVTDAHGAAATADAAPVAVRGLAARVAADAADDALEAAFAEDSLDAVCRAVTASAASAGGRNDTGRLLETLVDALVNATARAAQESEIPNFKGSDLGRFPLVLADFWTSDHLSERPQSVDAFSGTRARNTHVVATLNHSLLPRAAAYVDADDPELVEQACAALTGVAAQSSLDPTGGTPLKTLGLVRGRGRVAEGLGGSDTTTPRSIASVVDSLLETVLFLEDAPVANASSNASAAAALLLETVDALAVAQLETLAVDEDSVGETFANFATANRRVLRSADESRFLGTATMNASATLRPLASLGDVASSVYMTLSEFAVDPYGASSDAGASTLRFLASDGAATRRRLAGASTNLTVALSVPSGDYGEAARRRARQRRVANVTCPCGYYGNVTADCGPYRNATVFYCDGVPGEYAVSCPLLETGVCAIYDGFDFAPACETSVVDGTTMCTCDLATGEAADASLRSRLLAMASTYADVLAAEPDFARAAVMLVALGAAALGCVAAVAWGRRLDRLDAREDSWKRESARPTLSRQQTLGRTGPFYRQTTWDRCSYALLTRHPVLSFYAVHRPGAPRGARAVLVFFEILVFMFCSALESNLEFPEPRGGCGSYDSEHDCVEGTRVYALDKSTIRALWSASARDSLTKPACAWDLCSQTCGAIEPGDGYSTSYRRFVFLALTLAVSFPLCALFERLFEAYVLGPVPEAVRARFPRLARLCCAAEGEAEASVAPDVEGAPDDEDRGAPPAPDFASCACPARRARRALAAPARRRRPAAAAEESLEAVLGLDKEASQHAPVDDELELAPPDGAAAHPFAAIVEQIEQPASLAALPTPKPPVYGSPGPTVEERGPEDDVALLVEDGDGVMEKKTTVPKALQKTLFDEKTADTLQWMPSATWEDDVGDGSRSLGDESSTGRRRRGTMQAAKRRSTDAARALAQYHYTVKAAVTMDQRRAERYALSSQLAAPVARGVAAQLRELDDLLAALEARRDARARDARIMVGKYRERLLRRWGWDAGTDEYGSDAAWRVELRLRHHMKDADRWHDRLVDLRARCDDDRAYLFNAQACEEIDQTLKFSSSAQAELVECERCSRLSKPERRIVERSAGYIDRSGDDDDGDGDVSAAAYLGAWAGIAAILAVFCWYLIATGSDLGRAATVAWLGDAAVGALLYFCVVLPCAILLFGVWFPSLVVGRFRAADDRQRPFPFKTKLPDSAAYFLLKGHPELHDLPAAKSILHPPTASIDDVVGDPEAIYEQIKWRYPLSTQIGIGVAILFLNIPELPLDVLFEEIFVLLPLATGLVVPHVGGSSVAAELANALVDLLASVAAVLAFCAVVFAGAQTTDFLERQGRRVWKALRSLV